MSHRMRGAVRFVLRGSGAILLLVMCGVASAFNEANVVHIGSGDTMTVQLPHGRMRIALGFVRAPEPRAPRGMAAKRTLGNLCLNARARLRAVAGTSHGLPRMLVQCHGRDAGLFLLRKGLVDFVPGADMPGIYRTWSGRLAIPGHPR